MSELALALVGGLGVFYLYTAATHRWSGWRLGPATTGPATSSPRRSAQWLVQAGLRDVRPAQFLAAVLSLLAVGSLVGFAIFGGLIPALVVGAVLATAPVAAHRTRRRRNLAEAQEAWPRMIEEIRVMTGSAGRSVPQALCEVGRRGPAELRPAFAAAQREWLLSTDFDRTLDALKQRLADHTADIVCETLLVAHQLGGTDLDRRLAALAEDRVSDTQGRKDAVARQAGARFARWFTVLVPVGMALVGMSIGDGRAAYATSYGQALVVVALVVIIACWLAATHVMALPEEQRVFPEVSTQGEQR